MHLCLVVPEGCLLWWLFIGEFYHHLRKDNYPISQLQSTHLLIWQKVLVTGQYFGGFRLRQFLDPISPRQLELFDGDYSREL